MSGVRIAPSILAADFARLAEEVARIEAAGADWVHVDVMDGHFVPNLTIGPCVVAALRGATALPLDVHLMIEEPARYLDAFIDAGADGVTFHCEVVDDPAPLVERLHVRGRRAGVAISPPTPVARLGSAPDIADLILVMTVNPGRGGQTFLREVLPKVRVVRDRAGERIDIEVDGGIGPGTVREVAEVGANVFVAGTAVFRAPDMAEAIGAIRAGAVAVAGRGAR